MAKQKDEVLNTSDLETAAETATEKTTRAKKELTQEDIDQINAGVEKLRSFGVSEKFDRVLGLVGQWHDKEGNKEAKNTVIESFGGSESFKDYIDGEFQEELNTLLGAQKALSTLNNIKSFYARRANTGTGRKKSTSVQIAGEIYQVSTEYLATLVDVPVAEKRELLLAHADTKKADSIEIL